MRELYLGWDIGGTKSSAIVVGADGSILGKKTWASETGRGPEAMLDDFIHAAEELRREFSGVEEIGVSVGGPLDPARGMIYSPPHLPGWDEWPLADMLAERMGLPVVVEHDAVACLLAEHLWGCAREVTHAVYLTAGTGCGAGALVNGRVLRGPAGQSTEIGHVRLADEGPVVYGKKGSVEAFCSGTGIVLLARAMFPERFDGVTETRELARLANEGDEEAGTILRKSAVGFGRVCAMFSDLFAPELIIIGSLASYLPEWWLQTIRQEWASETLPRHQVSARICSSSLRDRLQDLSAVAACVFARRQSERVGSL